MMKSMTPQEKVKLMQGDLIEETLTLMNVNVEKIKDHGGKFNDLEHGLRTPGKVFPNISQIVWKIDQISCGVFLLAFSAHILCLCLPIRHYSSE